MRYWNRPAGMINIDYTIITKQKCKMQLGYILTRESRCRINTHGLDNHRDQDTQRQEKQKNKQANIYKDETKLK